MSAEFDPKTGRLQSMEQAGDFTFDEGDRKARAAKATLDAQDVMFLAWLHYPMAYWPWFVFGAVVAGLAFYAADLLTGAR